VQQAEVNTGGLYAPGHVVQSIYSSNSYQTSTTGTTYTDVLSALGVTWEIAITPKSASSVIDLMANLSISLLDLGFNAVFAGVRIQRKIGAGAYSTIFNPMADGSGPTDLGVATSGTAISQYSRHHLMLRDSPATISPVTYKFQISVRYGSGSQIMRINTDSTTDGQSFVFLNEVAV
jgi:hypothetical protein